MHKMEAWEILVILLVTGPVSIFVVTVYVLSALGKSLGFRRKYVQLLLYIFEYGRKRIEKAHREKYGSDEEDNTDDVSSKIISLGPKVNGNAVKVVESPEDMELRNRRQSSLKLSDDDEQSDLNSPVVDCKSDFELSDIFHFVKYGIEAIVEDQVTQRFVAEELKSWNLLTRTNRHYEFISWRLSLIWLVGFFIRYFVMLPFRVTICFLGTLTLMSLTFLIGLLPNDARKRSLNSWASRFCFRLLARAFSAIITYHCNHNKPIQNGICVANHTSPIDVGILACESTFALVVFLTMATALVGSIPKRYGVLRRRLYNIVSLQAFEVFSWSISAVITHHDYENRPGGAIVDESGSIVRGFEGGGGICVANHTSPIDVVVLAVDNCYDMIGQRHGGFLGILQRALARASSHIWFERSEMKDREAVARRLKEHVEDKTKLPILIFPEGTCINNSAVMQFKKGSFEVGGVIYPVAIKYDARFGDPFWDSSKYSMLQYLYMMMTSWAIVCDVWYLPPMTRKQGESAVDFANRVKSLIARKGGLVDLDWDGQLKRTPAKKEWKEQQQLEYSKKFVNSSPRHIVSAVEESNSTGDADNPNPCT
ncbi:Glycerol-3-phosphate acyltransferase 3 [Orchesella cincta]|uniref:Glycerol-3-phosphate acyltransferase 3 n=1 Tax=Orchesella cincta TaxID=48709 RepID=A0A1D2MF74_ORCCI|nr:Glycerol-3-phosphate acyltransferase 3 [Orchesella cincta]